MAGALTRLPGAILLALGLAVGAADAAPPRVLSLGQCSDQYVLALAPRSSIVGLSPRVGDRDSYLRTLSAGLPRRRPSIEAVLAARPEVVVVWWIGDERLARALVRRRIRVVHIDDASDFGGVRVNIRRVAAALDRTPQGEALIARMDAQLAAGKGAWGGRSALYLTSAGFTTGSGTLVDAIMTGAGLKNAAPGPGYRSVSLERLIVHPPGGFVLGFFDAFGLTQQEWGPGRNSVLQRLIRGRTIGQLPASESGCPAWFAGDAVQGLAAGARRP
jgi:iron complex transport system substrate-binding protein